MNTLLRRYAWLFLFVFACPGLQGQHPFFLSLAPADQFRDIRTKRIHEQSNGRLWFAANTGLLSYDGLAFRILSRPDSLPIEATAIDHDHSGRLWVGFADGLICSLQQNWTLQPWQPEEGLPKVPITGFAFEKSGRMWLSTYGEGLYCFDAGRFVNFNSDDGLSGDDIYVLRSGTNGEVFAGTDQGISICSYTNGRKDIRRLDRKDGLPDDIIYDLLPDSKGNFWIATYEKGVCLYNTTTKKIEFPLPTWQLGVVNCLELFEEVELWIGTENAGIWRYSLQNGSLLPVGGNHKLSNANIYDLQKDAEGNIWVVSNAAEIYHANRQFELLRADLPNIQTVFVDSRHRLWLGTPAGLYEHLPDSTGQSKFKLAASTSRLNITSLNEDAYGNLWVGTFGTGLFLFQPDRGKWRKYQDQNELLDGNIFSMARSNSHMWLGTLGGAVEFNVSKNILDGGELPFNLYNHQKGIGADFIFKIFIDSRGRVWFGTDGKGITKLENGRFTNYESAGEYSLNTVYSITEDRRGHIWLSSPKQGIFEFDGESFKNLSLPEGIRDLTITSLDTDIKGNILIVHPKGIDLLNPLDRHLTYFDQEIGVKEIDPNLNATATDPFGNIWIGTQNGLVRYTALRESLVVDPRTLINSVSIFLEPVNFHQKNTYDYFENYFIFDCIGLWYTDPGTVEYRYKLEGHDFDWKISSDRVISYPRLPSGKYTFMIQSTENGAFADEAVVRYDFTILPPIWRRWWFILACLVVGAAFLRWLIKSRESRLQRETLLKKASIESQFEALKSQINPHFLFNSFNTLISIIEDNPKKAVEYVEHLSDFYRSIMQYREKEVIPLQEEIEIVKSFIYLLKQRYGNNLSLHVDSEEVSGYVVPLSLQMLVENAIKHNVISKSKPLDIKIHDRESEYICVSNNLQLKMTPEISTGFGLQSIARRYELLTDRQIRVEKTDHSFEVCLPIIKNGV